MKMFKFGDKSKAICEHCASLVPTTFKYRDVPFSDGVGLAKNILVSVCDQCDHVVAIPAQSTPAIKVAREEAARSLEVKLPATLVEVLDLAAFTLNPETTTAFRKPLIAFYIQRNAFDNARMQRLVELARAFNEQKKAWKGMPSRRLSMKFSSHFFEHIEAVEKNYAMSKTDLIGSIALMIKEDIIDPDTPVLDPNLHDFAELLAA